MCVGVCGLAVTHDFMLDLFFYFLEGHCIYDIEADLQCIMTENSWKV